MESDLRYESCEICGGRQSMIIDFLGKTRKVKVLCKCQDEKLNAEREIEKNKQLQKRLERLKAYSLMDENFNICTFDNWIRSKENDKLFAIGKKYCKQWQKMKEENIGLLIWGPPGTGKSYFSFCIANALLKEMVPVVAISSIGLLNRIKATYGSYGQEEEIEIINSLKNASLLILDDLGAENGTEWSNEKLYEIIDSRYRMKKPMIITTNLSLEGLKNKLTSRDGINRTYDRLMEMCTPIEIQDKSKRAEAGKQKTLILKELLSS